MLAALLLAALAPAPALAQITYESEVVVPAFEDPNNTLVVIPTVQTPTSPSDPLYNPALDPAQFLITDAGYYKYTTSSISNPAAFPNVIKLDPLSMVAIIGQGTNDPVAYIYSNPLVQLIRYDLTTNTIVLPSPFLDFFSNKADSLAVSQTGGVTMIADGLGYSVDPSKGTGTLIFNGNGGGNAPGQFSNALYQDYGPNGLLYVLDYGNQRVQVLDPANAFAPVGQFALQAGLANMAFAIGPDGNFYFGDGNGGGQAYTANGTYEGSFATGTSTPTTATSNAPYVSADGKGDVFVFDSTGAHQFLDTSVVPEPATWALFILGLVGLFAIGRQRSFSGRRSFQSLRTSNCQQRL